MKISEAARITLRKGLDELQNSYLVVESFVFSPDLPKVTGCCIIGGVFLGASLPLDKVLEVIANFSMDVEEPILEAVRNKWPQMETKMVDISDMCGEEGAPVTLREALIHLNDDTYMTQEEIIEWLESIGE
jgi:hypothetical protein